MKNESKAQQLLSRDLLKPARQKNVGHKNIDIDSGPVRKSCSAIKDMKHRYKYDELFHKITSMFLIIPTIQLLRYKVSKLRKTTTLYSHSFA
jgi:hypothetical protein